MKIGYICNNNIGHRRYKEAIKILCRKTGSDFVISSFFGTYKKHLSKYKECDLIIDQNRVYKRQRPDQKIVYWYTGLGDLSINARDTRQTCKDLDYVITPMVRSIKDKSRYSKYKMIGNPISIYFDDVRKDMLRGSYDKVLVPEQKCFSDEKKIFMIAEKIAEINGLEVIYKKRDNTEDINKNLDYFKQARYIVSGFSSMAFEGIYFGIRAVLVKGLSASNDGNNNKMFYATAQLDYPELFIYDCNEIERFINGNYGLIRREHFNKDFIQDFMEIINGNC